MLIVRATALRTHHRHGCVFLCYGADRLKTVLLASTHPPKSPAQSPCARGRPPWEYRSFPEEVTAGHKRFVMRRQIHTPGEMFDTARTCGPLLGATSSVSRTLHLT